jgi:hypothetical protein
LLEMMCHNVQHQAHAQGRELYRISFVAFVKVLLRTVYGVGR